MDILYKQEMPLSCIHRWKRLSRGNSQWLLILRGWGTLTPHVGWKALPLLTLNVKFAFIHCVQAIPVGRQAGFRATESHQPSDGGGSQPGHSHWWSQWVSVQEYGCSILWKLQVQTPVCVACIGSKYLSVYMYVFVCVCLQREATVAEGVDEVSADGWLHQWNTTCTSTARCMVEVSNWLKTQSILPLFHPFSLLFSSSHIEWHHMCIHHSNTLVSTAVTDSWKFAAVEICNMLHKVNSGL